MAARHQKRKHRVKGRHPPNVGRKAPPQSWTEHRTVKAASCPVSKETVVTAVPCLARNEAETTLTEGKEAMEVEENKRATHMQDLKKEHLEKLEKEELVHKLRPMQMKQEEEWLQELKKEEVERLNRSKEDDRVDMKPPPLLAKSCSISSRSEIPPGLEHGRRGRSNDR